MQEKQLLPVERKRERADRKDGGGGNAPKYPNQTAFHQHLASSDNVGPELSVTRNWHFTDVQKNLLNVRAVLTCLCIGWHGQQTTRNDSLHPGVHNATTHVLFLL